MDALAAAGGADEREGSAIAQGKVVLADEAHGAGVDLAGGGRP